jgi:hypothetical protein
MRLRFMPRLEPAFHACTGRRPLLAYMLTLLGCREITLFIQSFNQYIDPDNRHLLTGQCFLGDQGAWSDLKSKQDLEYASRSGCTKLCSQI